MANQQDLIKIYRDLASTCRDAEEGLNKAAKGVHDDELRRILDVYSVERSQFAAEWDEQVRAIGAEAGDTGHGGGVLRAGWNDLEQRIRPKEDAETMQQAATGDEGGLAHFEHAIAEGIPQEARDIAERQMMGIRSAVEHIRMSAGTLQQNR
jgi:uncharacterized protein (TIGR02284 family)